MSDGTVGEGTSTVPVASVPVVPVRATPRIVPVLIPHGGCGLGCPLCPEQPAGESTVLLLPDPGDVARAMLRYAPPARRDGTRTLLAFYGGSIAGVAHSHRAPLLDAAEREFRNGRVDGIRLVCDPPRLLHAQLGEWVARGVRSVEIAAWSLDPRVLRQCDARTYGTATRDAVRRLRWMQIEAGVQLMPGLPGDSHERAVESARRLAELQPDFVRILPALALEDTRMERWWRSGSWDPMSLPQAVETCAAMLEVFRAAGVAVARVGLQPEFDLARGPLVLEGPYHPSLRMLAESRRVRRRIFELVRDQPFGRELEVHFHPADETYVRGPSNENLRELGRRLRIRRFHLYPDPTRPRGEPLARTAS